MGSPTVYQPVTAAETGYLRDQRFVRLVFRPFVTLGSARHSGLRLHRRLRVALSFDTPPAAQTVAFSRPDPYFEHVLQRTLINYEQAKGWRLPGERLPATEPVAAAAPALNTGQRLRILIDQDGMVVVTYADVAATGVNLAKLDPRTFRLEHGGQEHAIFVAGEGDGSFDPGDYLLFYGQRSTTNDTSQSAYWLSWGSGQGQRMTQRAADPALGGNPVTSYLSTQHLEENETYLSALPASGVADRWYWNRYSVGGHGEITTLIYPAALSAPLPGETAQLRAVVRGYTSFFDLAPDHRLQFYVNDAPVGDGAWDGQSQLDAVFSFDSDLLVSGQNVIKLFAPGDTGASNDVGYVNWFEITYERQLQAIDDQLSFSIPALAALSGERNLYQVGGFSSDDVQAYDVSDPAHPVRLTGLGLLPDPAHSFEFSDDASPGQGLSSADIGATDIAAERRARCAHELSRSRQSG